jgi:predicted PurR-regulated permease PerM
MTTNPQVPVIAPEPEAPASASSSRPRLSNEEIASWIIFAALLTFIMFEHLVAGVVAGLALYLILDRLTASFSKRLSHNAARPLALLLVTVIIGGTIIGGIALMISFTRHHADNIPAMMTKMAEILQSTRAWLGGYGEQVIPDVLTDAETIKDGIVEWLKDNATTLKGAGGYAGAALLHMLMGILLAILVFFRHATRHDVKPVGPLATCLSREVDRFAHAFSRIALAQIKISAVNTSLTALYLFVVLPSFGKHVPFATTIVVITFVCGLIPVLGNLISNTVIVILSLGLSVGTAVASLVFLILIHKLEYLINSRIVGGETDSQAWEILLAILIGESSFGIAGVVMAPIIYAFIKRELRDRGLV